MTARAGSPYLLPGEGKDGAGNSGLDVSMGDEVCVGLAVSSFVADEATTAEFSEVKISKK